MTRCKHNLIENHLAHLYRKYGLFITRYPIPFIIVPLVITAICGAGLYKLKRESDTEYLFTPKNSDAKKDRDRFENLFTESQGFYDTLRSPYFRSYAGLIVTHEKRENLFTQENIKNLMTINEEIRAFRTKDGKSSYADVCARRNGECMENSFLSTILKNDSGNVGKSPITYPIYQLNIGGGNDPVNVYLGSEIGGVTTDNNKQIKTIEAFEFRFFTSHADEDDWLENFLDQVDKIKKPGLVFHKVTSNTLDDELSRSSKTVISRFSILFTLLISFSIFTQMWLGDWVRSKPLLAFMGVISSGLSIVTGFGLLNWFGVKFIDIVLTSPFLAISIGCDDMFVLIASWRTTDQRKSIGERMADTFEEGGVSITITTLTDVLAIAIGITSSFRSVQIFCGYLAVILLFDFIYQITFFSAFMVYDGMREKKNRHCYSLREVLSKSECDEEEKSKSYRLFCQGGISRSEREDSQMNERRTIDNEPHLISEFFKTKFALFISHPFVKANTLILYIAFLGGTIYGCTKVDLGMELSRLAPDDSYVLSYYNEQNRYFHKYFFGVSVVIDQQINYLEAGNIAEINKIRQSIKNLPNIYDEYLGNDWLIDFDRFKSKHNIVINSEEELYSVLKNQFLKQPAYRIYNLDIVFDDSNKKIKASRFFVISKDSGRSTTQVTIVREVRDIIKKSKFKMFSFSALFIIVEQYMAVLPNTLQNLGIATAAMLVISIVLIPDIATIFWVTFSILSICAGVIGFMSFWSVNIDTISMINLVMCIGFSVDFSAHVSYAFVKAPGETGLEKMQNAFEKIAFPVVLGGVSTILGLLGMASTNVYIFRVFFKTMILVMLFGLLHGLLFLPTIMMTISGLCKKRPRSPQIGDTKFKA